MALMVQKEVAEKILSVPGKEGWGTLSVRCQYAYHGEIAMEVPASCFTPVPKVDSAFVVLEKLEKPCVEVLSEKDFFRIVQAGFALRRKTLTNALAAAEHLEREQALDLMNRAALDPRVRGEQLSIQELGRLSNVYSQWKEENGGNEGSYGQD